MCILMFIPKDDAKYVKGRVQFYVDHIASFNASASPSTPDSTAGSSPVTLMSPDEAMRRLRQ